MKLVKGAWKLLVGIKDALVLIFMLLFFGLIFAALSARPNTTIKDGALVIARAAAAAPVIVVMQGMPARTASLRIS